MTEFVTHEITSRYPKSEIVAPNKHVHVVFHATKPDELPKRHTIEGRSIGEVLIMVMHFLQEKVVFSIGAPFMVQYVRGDDPGDTDSITILMNGLNRFKITADIDECYCDNWGEDSADPPF